MVSVLSFSELIMYELIAVDAVEENCEQDNELLAIMQDDELSPSVITNAQWKAGSTLFL